MQLANLTHVPTQYLPVGEVFSLIGEKWTVKVMAVLSRGQGRKRFGELRKEVEGISQKMLANSLRELERDGYIARTIFPVIPPRVEYELTELGQKLLEPLWALGQFAMDHREHVEAARVRFDSEQAASSLASVTVVHEVSVTQQRVLRKPSL
jgi:DNA-binding HxlR family transcriptional regulator